MARQKALSPRRCATCLVWFQPAPGGYNALYCQRKCKPKGPRKSRAGNSQYWLTIKADPRRYSLHRLRSEVSRRKVRDWLAKYKLGQGCIDCGFKGHYAALQLDHTGPKGVEIAKARSSIGRLLEEIEKGKCVVRCANCHSIKTWERKQK